MAVQGSGASAVPWSQFTAYQKPQWHDLRRPDLVLHGVTGIGLWAIDTSRVVKKMLGSSLLLFLLWRGLFWFRPGSFSYVHLCLEICKIQVCFRSSLMHPQSDFPSTWLSHVSPEDMGFGHHLVSSHLLPSLSLAVVCPPWWQWGFSLIPIHLVLLITQSPDENQTLLT